MNSTEQIRFLMYETWIGLDDTTHEEQARSGQKSIEMTCHERRATPQILRALKKMVSWFFFFSYWAQMNRPRLCGWRGFEWMLLVLVSLPLLITDRFFFFNSISAKTLIMSTDGYYWSRLHCRRNGLWEIKKNIRRGLWQTTNANYHESSSSVEIHTLSGRIELTCLQGG